MRPKTVPAEKHTFGLQPKTVSAGKPTARRHVGIAPRSQWQDWIKMDQKRTLVEANGASVARSEQKRLQMTKCLLTRPQSHRALPVRQAPQALIAMKKWLDVFFLCCQCLDKKQVLIGRHSHTAIAASSTARVGTHSLPHGNIGGSRPLIRVGLFLRKTLNISSNFLPGSPVLKLKSCQPVHLCAH